MTARCLSRTVSIACVLCVWLTMPCLASEEIVLKRFRVENKSESSVGQSILDQMKSDKSDAKGKGKASKGKGKSKAKKVKGKATTPPPEDEIALLSQLTRDLLSTKEHSATLQFQGTIAPHSEQLLDGDLDVPAVVFKRADAEARELGISSISLNLKTISLYRQGADSRWISLPELRPEWGTVDDRETLVSAIKTTLSWNENPVLKTLRDGYGQLGDEKYEIFRTPGKKDLVIADMLLSHIISGAATIGRREDSVKLFGALQEYAEGQKFVMESRGAIDDMLGREPTSINILLHCEGSDNTVSMTDLSPSSSINSGGTVLGLSHVLRQSNYTFLGFEYKYAPDHASAGGEQIFWDIDASRIGLLVKTEDRRRATIKKTADQARKMVKGGAGAGAVPLLPSPFALSESKTFSSLRDALVDMTGDDEMSGSSESGNSSRSSSRPGSSSSQRGVEMPSSSRLSPALPSIPGSLPGEGGFFPLSGTGQNKPQ